MWTVILLTCFNAMASTVYHNGTIRIGDEDQTVTDWIAIADGKVLDYGKGKRFRQLNAEKQIDLKGRTLMPGLTDSHLHLTDLGMNQFQVDLKGCRSADEAAERVRKVLSQQPAGAIVGNGWDQSDWPGKQFPHRSSLDNVLDSRPIILYRIDGHAAWVNTYALKHTPAWTMSGDPAGGQIIRDSKGIPTGVLIDKAMSELEPLIGEPSDEQLERYLLAAVKSLVSVGVTGAHDAGASPREIAAIRRLLKRNAVRFRFYEMLSVKGVKNLSTVLTQPEIDPQHWLTIRTVKLFLDGAMGSWGAALEKPYSDKPESTGILRMTASDLETQVRAIDSKGYQIAIHAIGDRANRIAIDALIKILGKHTQVTRPRIEHVQMLRSADPDRILTYKIIASMQPIHCTSDMKWVVQRIGPERARFTYAWNSLQTAPLAFGSDAPMDDFIPWHGLFAAVTRQTASFEPAGGFYPEQIVSLERALQAFTLGAAYASFSENALGSLEKGKLADFIVVDQDPFKATLKALYATKVLETYIGGERVFPCPL
ncbi:MAG: amidohydrolase [Deltaproteobacteria bacterium]|nr:amidohydrolase [Deltaproteobacteria bacterium]